MKSKKRYNPMDKYRKRYQSLCKVLMLITCFTFLFGMTGEFGCMIMEPLMVHAADGGTLKNKDTDTPGEKSKSNKKSVNGSYTFEKDLVKGAPYQTTFLKDWSQMTGDVQRVIAGNFKSATEYNKWYKKAIKYISHDGSEDSGVTFNAKPIIPDGANENQEAGAWTQYQSIVNQLDRILARGAVSSLTDDIFSTDEFDPTNAFVFGLMENFKNFMQTVFNIVSQALMWLFLGQTGCDTLYIAIPGTGAILARGANSGGSGGAGAGKMGGGAGQGSSIFSFNIVSEEAVEVVNGSTAGGTGAMKGGAGGAGGGNGGLIASNKAINYLKLRLPLIVLCGTYIVLVVSNLWPRLISALSSFVASALYSVV